MKHLLPKQWLKYLFFPALKNYRFRKYDRRILRRQNIFQNYKTAYEEYKNETGLVYVHLTKTKEMDFRINLIDQFQKKHLLKLNQFEFVLQKKACLVSDHINRLMLMNQKQEAVDALRTLMGHIVAQCNQGFIDQDSGVFHNYGFIENQVIHFDIGRMQFKENNQIFTQKEILRIGGKIAKWLEIHQPILLPDFEKIMTDLGKN